MKQFNRDEFFLPRSLCFIFICFSIMGWLYESLLFFTRHIPFENNGFLFGPYLPIYGVGGLLVVFLCCKWLKGNFIWNGISLKPLVIFVVMIVVSTGIELIVGYVFDYMWGLRLWDYRTRIYNLGGYICVGASLRFGLIGVAIYYFIFPIFAKLFQWKYRKKLIAFNIILLSIMCLDFIYKMMRI